MLKNEKYSIPCPWGALFLCHFEFWVQAFCAQIFCKGGGYHSFLMNLTIYLYIPMIWRFKLFLLVHYISNPPNYFVEKLHNSHFKGQDDDKSLCRIIISRAEVRLHNWCTFDNFLLLYVGLYSDTCLVHCLVSLMSGNQWYCYKK